MTAYDIAARRGVAPSAQAAYLTQATRRHHRFEAISLKWASRGYYMIRLKPKENESRALYRQW